MYSRHLTLVLLSVWPILHGDRVRDRDETVDIVVPLQACATR